MYDHMESQGEANHITMIYRSRSRFSTSLGILECVRQTVNISTAIDLQAALPAYMIPMYVFYITQLPLTKSGKLDRRLLRARAGGVFPEDIEKWNRYRIRWQLDGPMSL